MPLKKIVVIGPESTGKSTLCAALAARYQTVWAREYAREYLELRGMDYQYSDLPIIARGQLAGEDAAAEKATEMPAAKASAQKANSCLFVDTDLYVIKVWSEFVFGRCETWVLEEIARRKYDGYLLCKTDLPWTDDPLREYPDQGTRERLYRIYKDLLVNQAAPWEEVGGTAEERFRHGVDAVERLLQ